MVFWRKYNTATHVYVPIIKRAVVDFAVSADWTPVAGDVKISKDGGAAANVTNLPTAITMGNTAMWDFSLTASELSAAKIAITVADAATKAVEDQMILIETYGNASAELKMDWSDSMRMGLTALPNAAAETAGGLYTRGSGAGQINQSNNGQIDANVVRLGGTAQTGRDIGASVLLTSQERLDIADALLDRANAIETGLTPRGAMRLGAAADAGKVAGASTSTVTIRNVGDTKTRITATVDADGNRTDVTTDAT